MTSPRSRSARARVAPGEIAVAPPVLGGRVRRGDRRGRLLGFPTANLARPRRDVRDGVYAAWVGIDGEPLVRPALASLGPIPTFGVRSRRLEVHLIDFDGDLYGCRLRVALCARLTGQRRCSSAVGLASRIAALVQRARRVLATPAVDTAGASAAARAGSAAIVRSAC